MRIGWLTKAVGIFGSIRGMLEISNCLIERGHDVTVYYWSGVPATWLANNCEYAKLDALKDANLDILIGMFDWDQGLFDVYNAAQAKVKALAIVGFEPTDDLARALRGEIEATETMGKLWREALVNHSAMVVRAPWERRWIQEHLNIRITADYAGISLRQFHRLNMKRDAPPPWRLIATGDPRERKGMKMVYEAWDILNRMGLPIEVEVYWGKNLPQAELVEWLNRGRVFCDGHERGGWCNPVLEAMACGVPVVCTEVPCTSDFAFDGVTALTVQPRDSKGMATAIARLMVDEDLRLGITRRATAFVQSLDYEAVVVRFERELFRLLEQYGGRTD